MVRRLGETADSYSRRIEKPQQEGESNEDYERRIETQKGQIELVHGLDSNKFITLPDGTSVLKDTYLRQGEVIEGTATETQPPKAIEVKQNPAKPEGTGQIG